MEPKGFKKVFFKCFGCRSTFQNIHKLVQHLRKCDNVIRVPAPGRETFAGRLRITISGLGNSGSVIRNHQMVPPGNLQIRREMSSVTQTAQDEAQQQGEIFPVKALMPLGELIVPEQLTSRVANFPVPPEANTPIHLYGRNGFESGSESNLECYFCRVPISSPQQLISHFENHCLFRTRKETEHARETHYLTKARTIVDTILSSQLPLWSIPAHPTYQMESICGETAKSHMLSCRPVHLQSTKKLLRKQLSNPY